MAVEGSAAVPAGRIEVRAGLPVLTWPGLPALGVDAVVTTRGGGVSSGPYESLDLGLHVGDDPAAVVENRRRAAAAIGLGLEDLVVCRQVHGRDVAVVGRADRGRGVRAADASAPAADALVTAEPGVGLVAMVADCVPVLLVDPVRPAIAVVHAGWRGIAAGVVPAAVEALLPAGGSAAGGSAARLRAFVGPAVPPERYQVGAEVRDAIHEALGAAAGGAVVEPDGTGRWRLDLWAAVATQLSTAGLPAEHVVISRRPTGPGTPFFSDRAARPCGRFALLARTLG